MFCVIPGLLLALVAGAPPASMTASPRSRPPLHVYRGVAPEYEALLTAPERRLRATDIRMQALIAEGVRRSRTFARLLVALAVLSVPLAAEAQGGRVSIENLTINDDPPPDEYREVLAEGLRPSLLRIRECYATTLSTRPIRSSVGSSPTPPSAGLIRLSAELSRLSPITNR